MPISIAIWSPVALKASLDDRHLVNGSGVLRRPAVREEKRSVFQYDNGKLTLPLSINLWFYGAVDLRRCCAE